MATLPDLLKLMYQRIGFEPVQKDEGAGTVWLFGRIRTNPVNARIFVHRLLLAAKTANWNAGAGKDFTLKNGQLAIGWRFSIQATDMPAALDQIMQVLGQAPQVMQKEVDEFPLPSATIDRNQPKPGSQKGAALTGQAVIGRR